ncbi:unnamed protein product, partial [Closterium sp. NIES-54]
VAAVRKLASSATPPGDPWEGMRRMQRQLRLQQGRPLKAERRDTRGRIVFSFFRFSFAAAFLAARIAMGLFGDLPPPSNAPKPPTRANPPPSTSTPSSKPSTPADRPAAVAPRPSALKSSLKGRADVRGEEGTGNVSAGDAGGGSGEGGKSRKRVGVAVADEADGGAPPRRRVRFHTFAEVAEDKVTLAIAKIATHIGTPTKFKKAAGLARQLLEGGALNNAAASGMNRGAGGMVVGAAGDVGGDYAALIGAAVEKKELFSAWQQQQVDVWGLRVVLAHSLRTDDSFQ